ncbi:MAG: triose-phosphate isomerase [Candidatus Moraniibacteriota bacterium]
MRDRFVIANLKMQWSGVDEAKMYLHFFAHHPEQVNSRVQIVLCGSFPFLERMRLTAPEEVAIGAQDVFWDDKGAYTGNVSAPMLRSIGVDYVILGHSERRIYNEETDADVLQKVVAALRAGLIPILCVGETKEEREAEKTNEVLQKQLLILKEVDWSRQTVLPIIAYEPRWAVGGQQTPSREEIVMASGAIRSTLDDIFSERISQIKVLYGGSVSQENVREVSVGAGLDGILVGRVSLRPEILASLAESLEK